MGGYQLMQKKYNIDMNPTAYRDITRYSNKDWNIDLIFKDL